MKLSKISFALFLFLGSTVLGFGGSFKSQFPEYTRTWIGPDYWANRLQDWRVTMGRLECLEGRANMPLRTVHWLSGEIADNGEAFEVSVRTGTLGFEALADGTAFSGVLLGAGEGELDYRGAALIHHHPGVGGGLLAVFNDKGQAQFLQNNDASLNRPILATGINRSPNTRTGKLGNFEDFRVTIQVGPDQSGERDLAIVVTDMFNGEQVSEVELTGYPSSKLLGGIALVSHGGKKTERRFWFREFEVSGSGIRNQPKRHFGPVVGVLYTVDGDRLKLNAQFPPLGFNDSQNAKLQLHRDGAWRDAGEEAIHAPSYTALFDLELAERTADLKYRVGYEMEGKLSWFTGTIPVGPKSNEEIRVVGLTCYQNMALSADGSWGEGAYGSPEGRWIPHNVHYPHNNLVHDLHTERPDLIALLGDQIYEGGNPTNSDHAEGNPHLDYLYKWYLTLADLGRITRHVPTVVLVDDHDVYQGDLAGGGGRANRDGDNKKGGYYHEPEFIQMVERTQTAANPEPQRREHISQGLTSYYTNFELGGVHFALMEDRKFKSFPSRLGPLEKYGSKIINEGYDGRNADLPDGQILGEQQEAFLRNWIRSTEGVRVAFTQTLFASLHTAPSGKLWLDVDAGGWPQTPRNRALEILIEGDVLLLAGDTHLPAVVQHGVRDFRDSVWQFVVPAVANKYRRWWEPNEEGANRRPGDPYYTGDYLDGFGNHMTVAAVGNPKLDNQIVYEENLKRDVGYASEHLFLDKNNYRDGYGVLVVSADRKTATFECWPAGPEAEQHPGWPVVLQKDVKTDRWIRR